MNEKKPIKISLSTFFLIIAIIVIIVMGIFIYKISVDKIKAEEKAEVLNSEVTELEGAVDNLQGKIDSISNTINSPSEEGVFYNLFYNLIWKYNQ